MEYRDYRRITKIDKMRTQLIMLDVPVEVADALIKKMLDDEQRIVAAMLIPYGQTLVGLSK